MPKTAPKTFESFADVLAPVTPEQFLGEYHGKKPLHIPGGADKAAAVMSWPTLTDILNQTSIWSSRSLLLVQDKRTLEPHEYCRPAKDRDGRDIMQPDFDRVLGWLRRGASLALNDIDNLTPGLKAAARALEQGLTSKVQANLYCSWQTHQAFPVHFDTHDVYALHIAGEKRWKVYQCPIPVPIEHPAFKTLGQKYHDTHHGPLSMELTMKPGDLLYIPRGWYHEALAVTPGTFHIAFGVTGVIGLDLVGMLFERSVMEPLVRTALPPLTGTPEDDRTIEAFMARVGDRLAALARDPKMVEQFKAYIKGFHYSRPALTLPGDAVSPRWRVRPGLEVFEEGGVWRLGDRKKNAGIPPGLENEVRWVVERPGFAEWEFEAAFPFLAPAKRRSLLGDLTGMKVIEPV